MTERESGGDWSEFHSSVPCLTSAVMRLAGQRARVIKSRREGSRISSEHQSRNHTLSDPIATTTSTSRSLGCSFGTRKKQLLPHAPSWSPLLSLSSFFLAHLHSPLFRICKHRTVSVVVVVVVSRRIITPPRNSSPSYYLSLPLSTPPET